MKSEAYFSREFIEHKRGRVLKENSINGRSWSSAKLFIMQNYIDNGNGDVPLTKKMCDILASFNSRCALNLLKRKTKLINRFLHKNIFNLWR